MTDLLIYNVPVKRLEAHCGLSLIVRSNDPAAVVEKLTQEHLEWILYLQILAPAADIHPLLEWGHGIPVDLVIQDPVGDLPFLYRWSSLLPSHPVRVTVPVIPGFSKIVKLAASLDLAVKLQVAQPGPALVDEMIGVLHAYLHGTTVTQPVEFFHSLFLSYYRKEPATLWSIQEEDPALFRYIEDDGEETGSSRYPGLRHRRDISSFVQEFKDSPKEACSCCEFLDECSGYFRFPSDKYPCEGIKAVFQTLRLAAEQLRGDLHSFRPRGEGEA